jgi:hypothetical protein
MQLGYEVVLLPALWASWGLAVLILAASAFGRADGEEIDGVMVRHTTVNGGRMRAAGAALLAGLVLLPAIVVTPPRHRAVIYSAWGGVSDHERPEGVSFVVPFAQTAVQFNVGVQRWYSEEVYAQSSDLQEITVVISVDYAPDPTQAAELYRTIGKDYANVLITPVVQHAVKERVGQTRAIDFAINRAALALAVEDQLTDELGQHGINVVFVAVEDAIFRASFIDSVAAKVEADQYAEEQRRLVAAEGFKRDQIALQADAVRITRETEAAGDRAAIQQVADALGFDADEYLRWLLLQRWDGVLPSTLVGDLDGDVGLLLNLESR